MAKKLNIPLTLIAKIGIYLQNPFGDGIRHAINYDPGEAYIAAMAECKGAPKLGGEHVIRKGYESKVREFVRLEKRRKNPDLLKQKVLTIAEAASLGITKKEPAFIPIYHLELSPFINSLEDVAEHIKNLIDEHGKDAHLNWGIASGGQYGAYRVLPSIIIK